MSVTELWFASAKKGDLKQLRRLRACADAPSTDTQDKRNRTALFLAASRGNSAYVQELLKQGADPNK